MGPQNLCYGIGGRQLWTVTLFVHLLIFDPTTSVFSLLTLIVLTRSKLELTDLVSSRTLRPMILTSIWPFNFLNPSFVGFQDSHPYVNNGDNCHVVQPYLESRIKVRWVKHVTQLPTPGHWFVYSLLVPLCLTLEARLQQKLHLGREIWQHFREFPLHKEHLVVWIVDPRS